MRQNAFAKYDGVSNPHSVQISPIVFLVSRRRKHAVSQRLAFMYSIRVRPVFSLKIRAKWYLEKPALAEMSSRVSFSAKW